MIAAALRRTALFALLAIPAGCSAVGDQLSDAVFMPNPNSNRRAGETMTLEIAFSDNTPAPDQPEDPASRVEGFVVTGSSIMGAAADIAIEAVSRTLAEEGKRYTASYSAEASSGEFYFHDHPTKDAARLRAGFIRAKSDIRFAGFRFERRIADKADPEGALAMSVCALALPGRTDRFFQLVPVSYSLRYSKAKLIGFDMLSPFGVDLLNPWEIVTNPLTGAGYKGAPADDDLDLTLAVSFDFLHYDDDDKLARTKAGPETFTLKGARATGKPLGGYFPAYAKFLAARGADYALDCGEGAPAAEIAALRDRILALPITDPDRMRLASGAKMFPSAPRALGAEGGAGNFTLLVEVTEFDDYGTRITEVSKAFDSNKKGLQQRVSDFVDGK